MSATEALVGRHRLLARIGEGGMGVVHLAEDPAGRRVALKILRPQVVGDDEGRERLAREVSSLSRVRSPHVAEILGADPWGPVPYVVTRFVPGLSLAETVRREGPLAYPDLGHVSRRLLEAVRDVHAAGVLHRDLKPTNVVMEGRSPVLIDFGLARVAEDPRLTAAGWLLGTPGYLAPEMLFGDPATAATDVHGWAATIAYAATGRAPYGGGHPMAVLDRTRRGDVDLEGVPEGLRRLLATCLVVEPAGRPTVAELARALAGLEAAAAPTRLVPAAPLAAPLAAPPAAPDRTVPWQLAAPEGSPADRLRPVSPPTDVLRSAPPTDVLRSAAPAPRQRTLVDPPPARIAPTPAQQPPAGAPVPVATRPGPATRLRRAALLMTLLALVTAAVAAAPYAAAAAVAVAVVFVRGVSLSQEATWRRRAARGARWTDAPRALAGFPWHVARGLPGAVLLLATAALLGSVVVGSLLVVDRSAVEALAAGGAVAGCLVWAGPCSERVRRPAGRAVTVLAARPWTGWSAVVALAGVAALAVLSAREGVLWAPGDAAPWTGLLDRLRAGVPL